MLRFTFSEKVTLLLFCFCFVGSVCGVSNSCSGQTSTDLTTCGSHGLCTGLNTCLCLDLSSTNSIRFSNATKFLQGTALTSSSGRFMMYFQDDANIVLLQVGQVAWALGSNQKAGTVKFEYRLGSDGSMTIFNSNDVPITSVAPACSSGVAPYTLVMQNDGYLVIYDSNGKKCWTPNYSIGAKQSITSTHSNSIVWTGNNCTTYTCFGKDYTSSVCNNGACSAPDTCTCNAGYYGKTCENYNCSGVASTDLTTCGGHGLCTAPNNCMCLDFTSTNSIRFSNATKFLQGTALTSSSGRYTMYFQDDANIVLLQGGQVAWVSDTSQKAGTVKFEYRLGSDGSMTIFNSNDVLINSVAPACSSGVAPYTLVMQNDGYLVIYDSTGKKCWTPNYSIGAKQPITSTDANNINWNGDKCNSTIYTCFGKLGTSSVCNNGACTAPDTCTCKSGYYGATCSNYTCFGKDPTSSICNNGSCTAPDTCTCKLGYYGSNCSNYTCFGKDPTSSICNNGSCTAPDICTCKSGYFGSNCSNFTCYSKDATSSVCNQGRCTSPDTCTCNAGYYGKTCENYNCSGVASTDLTTCGGHGLCTAPNNCMCLDFTSTNSIRFSNATKFLQGTALTSSSGRFMMYFQDDANIVLLQVGQVAWALGSNQKSGTVKFEYRLGSDGSMTIFNSNDVPITSVAPACSSGVAPYTLVMQNDGYLVIYDSTGKKCWTPNYSIGAKQSITSTHSNSIVWTGNNCTTYTCFGKSSISSVCNNGSCTAPDICTCKVGYLGPTCSNYTCYGQNYKSSVCNNGSCTAPDICTCNSGYHGATCSNYTCFGKDPTSSICNNGSCTAPDICTCKSGYHGATCSNYTCYGKDPTSSICNNGSCTAPDTCTCREGFFGKTCSNYTCYGQSSNSSVCNNGSCTAPDICTCKVGYLGPTCSNYTCYGQNYKSSICNNGSCTAPDICTCKSGYHGATCSNYTCYGKDPTSSICNNGSCTAPDTCTCREGFFGKTCSNYTCYGQSSNSSVCNNGSCTAYDTCTCKTGYFGSFCNTTSHTCYGQLSTSSVCNNGTCTAPDTCTCSEGIYGTYCNLTTTCFLTKFDNSSVCGGVGLCTSLDTCLCLDLSLNNSKRFSTKLTIRQGETLNSSSGRFLLKFQSDGQMVTYDSQTNNTVVWTSGETIYANSSQSVFEYWLNDDGSIQIFEANRYKQISNSISAKCSSSGPFTLVLQNDGLLVLYSISGNMCWKSGNSPVTGFNNANGLINAGPACSPVSCFGKSQKSSVCNNGFCTSLDTCSCNAGYFGKTCSDFSCFGRNSSVCNNGSCTAPDTCTCNPGYIGSNCSIFTCFGKSQFSSVCNHGVCSSIDTCTCFPSYYGSNCSVLQLNQCYGKLQNDTSVCGGHGFCIGNNNCSCLDLSTSNSLRVVTTKLQLSNMTSTSGRFSMTLTNNGMILKDKNTVVWSMDLLASSAINTVSYELDVDGSLLIDSKQVVGPCIGFAPFTAVLKNDGTFGIYDSSGFICWSTPNQMVSASNSLSWTGSQCDFTICFNKPSTSLVCNNGTCVAPNTCACNPGYTGTTCLIPNCNSGYIGKACSNYTCFGQSQNSSVCNKGACTAPDTCTCNAGYYGKTCANYNCSGVASTDLTTCGGHGLCTAPNNCICLDFTTKNSIRFSNATKFLQGTSLTSSSGRYTMYFQDDANIVLLQGGQVAWVSDTSQKAGTVKFEYRLGSDGSMTIFNSNDVLINSVAPACSSGIAPYTLVMQNDGYLVIYDSTGKKCWTPNYSIHSKQPITSTDANNINWNGDKCNSTIYTCYGKLGTSSVCNNGACTAPDTCTCKPGYYGKTCSNYDCYGLPSTTSTCNFGQCTSPNTCTCNPGYTGISCAFNLPVACGGKSQTDATVCSGHGLCTSYGVCTCLDLTSTNSWISGTQKSPQSLVSLSGIFTVKFQDDANILLYNRTKLLLSLGSISLTGKTAAYYRFDDDGSLSVYSSSGTLINTVSGSCQSKGGLSPYRAVIQDNGIFTIYGANGITCFSSKNTPIPSGSLTWKGSLCSVTTCFGQSSTSSVCNNGNCTSPDTCTCVDGYFGKTCSNYTCFGQSATSSVCNNGTCSSLDTCTCNPGFVGKTCTNFTCFGKPSTSSVCNNGNCSAPDTCTCNAGYFGSSCLEFTCFGESVKSSVCNHGKCTAPDTCTCNAGYNGTRCELGSQTKCFGKISSDLTVCSGRGVCMDSDTCSCLDLSSNNSWVSGTSKVQLSSITSSSGRYTLTLRNDGSIALFDGPNYFWSSRPSLNSTSNLKAYQFVFGDDGSISAFNNLGIRETVAIDACNQAGSRPFRAVMQNDGIFVIYGSNGYICWSSSDTPLILSSNSLFWNGSQCSVTTCYGQSSTSSVCNHGTCIAPDTCSCGDGYFGKTCSNYTCFGQSATSSVCNYGKCSSLDTCTCNTGYIGKTCSNHTCFGQSATSSVCNHGTCTSLNFCTCDVGYLGDVCSITTCFGEPSTGSVCNHGKCTSLEKCTCETGYSGKTCANYNCSGVASTDLTTCGGHGLCTAPNNCMCLDFTSTNSIRFSNATTIPQGTTLTSSSGRYTLTFQYDSSIVLFKDLQNVWSVTLRLAPGTSETRLGSDGSMTIYKSNGVRLISVAPACSSGVGPYTLVVQNDGYLVIYDSTGKKCWTPNYTPITSTDANNVKWNGDKCNSTIYTCYGKLGTSSVCNNGACTAPDTCTCKPGYYGNTCSNYNCFGKHYNDTSVCGGHGLCTDIDTCLCLDLISTNSIRFYNSSTILQGTTLTSSSGRYTLTFQYDSSIVMRLFGVVIWSIRSFYSGNNFEYRLGSYGMTVYNSNGNILKSVAPQASSSSVAPYTLVMQNDGYLVMYDGNGKKCWTPIYSITAPPIPSPDANNVKWNGNICNSTIYTCYGKLGTSSVCNNGACTAPDTCTCKPGYYGNTCSNYNCFGKLNNNTSVCGGHGLCTDIDTCLCLDLISTNSIRFYNSSTILQGTTLTSSSGRYTLIFQHDGNIVFLQDQKILWGLGTYFNPGTKFEYRLGSDGSMTINYSKGDAYSAKSACSSASLGFAPFTLVMQNDGYLVMYDGNGKKCWNWAFPIQANTTNSNAALWTDSNCSPSTCFGQNSSSSVCNNGTCTSYDTCTCKEGYYGETCSNFTCFGQTATSSVCNYGFCSALNTCQCNKYYSGSVCNITTCFGILSNNVSVCSNKGKCKSFDTCSCIEGFSGPRCDIAPCTINCLYGTCENRTGIAKCVCNSSLGFVPSEDKSTCICKSGMILGGVCTSSVRGTPVCSTTGCGSGTCVYTNAYTNMTHCSCNSGYVTIDSSKPCSSCMTGYSMNVDICEMTCPPEYSGSNCDVFTMKPECSSIPSSSIPFCKTYVSYRVRNTKYTIGATSDSIRKAIFAAQLSTLDQQTNATFTQVMQTVQNQNLNCDANCQNSIKKLLCYQAFTPCNQITSNSVEDMYWCSEVCNVIVNKEITYATLFNNSCASLPDSNCYFGSYLPPNTTCFDKSFSDSTVCSGRGTCIGQDTCSCSQGYTGNNCQFTVCFGKDSNTTGVCNGNGQCTAPNVCTCSAGYTAYDCSVPTCNGKTQAQGACSSNGLCTAPNTCQCYGNFEGSNCGSCKAGFTGLSCNIPICNDLPATNGGVCGGRGVCTSVAGVPKCACNSGYSGSSCQNFQCNNIDRFSSNVCSGRGNCISSGVCKCSGNYDPDSYCSLCLTGYSGDGCKNKTSCSCNSHGSCDSSFKCLCYGNWVGENCNTCQSGYVGDNCQIQCSSSTTCNSKGTCTNSGTCSCIGNAVGPTCASCSAGWYGSNCDFQIVTTSFGFSTQGDSITGTVFSSLKTVESCSSIITNTSTLGKDPVCIFNGATSQLQIILGSLATIGIGDNLQFRVYLNSPITVLVALSQKDFQVVPPVGQLVADKSQISQSCGSVYLDASGSVSLDRRQLIFSWKAIATPTDSDSEYLNNLLSSVTTSGVSISGEKLSVGVYSVQVTVLSSFTQAQSIDSISFQVSDISAPIVNINQGLSSTYTIGTSSLIIPLVTFPTCYNGTGAVQYSYTQNIADSHTTVSIATQNEILVFSKDYTYFTEEGEYFFTLKVSQTGAASTTTSFKVVVVSQPLQISFSTTGVTQSYETPVSFSLSIFDPSFPSSTDGNVTLSCVNLDTASICEEFSDLNSNIDRNTLKFNRKMKPGVYLFKTEFTKSTRSISETVKYVILDQSSSSLIRIQIKDIGRVVNPSQDLVLQSLLSDSVSSSRVFTWSSSDFSLDPTTTTLTNTFLVIPKSLLAYGASFTVTVSVVDGKRSGSASVYFTVDSPPTLGEFEIDPPMGKALVDSFKLKCANGWTSSQQPLMYEFQYKIFNESAWKVLSAKSETKSISVSLPAGKLILKAVVYNSFGTSTETTQNIEVSLPDNNAALIALQNNAKASPSTSSVSSALSVIAQLTKTQRRDPPYQLSQLQQISSDFINKYLEQSSTQELLSSISRDSVISMLSIISSASEAINGIDIDTVSIIIGNFSYTLSTVVKSSTIDLSMNEISFSHSTAIAFKEYVYQQLSIVSKNLNRQLRSAVPKPSDLTIINDILMDLMYCQLKTKAPDMSAITGPSIDSYLYARYVTLSTLSGLSEIVDNSGFSISESVSDLFDFYGVQSVKLFIKISRPIDPVVKVVSKLVEFRITDPNNNQLEISSTSFIANIILESTSLERYLITDLDCFEYNGTYFLSESCNIINNQINSSTIQVQKTGIFVVAFHQNVEESSITINSLSPPPSQVGIYVGVTVGIFGIVIVCIVVLVVIMCIVRIKRKKLENRKDVEIELQEEVTLNTA